MNDPDIQKAYDYVAQKAEEFKRSMDPRCFRHHHDFRGNVCRRCGFLIMREAKLNERPGGGDFE